MKQLEKDLNKHHAEVGEIKQAIKVLAPASKSTKESIIPLKTNHSQARRNFGKLTNEMVYDDTCPLHVASAPRTNIQVT